MAKKKIISTGELTGPSWDDTVKRVAKQIYDEGLDGPISDEMVTRMAGELMKGVFEGYGMDFDSKELAAEDFEMLQAIEKNVFIFSGFKNEKELREVSDMLKGPDGVKDFKTWFEGVRQIDSTYNQTYARAEYNTATTTAISISREQTFQKEKDALPYAEWVATGDEAECEVCEDLDGTILHVDDPFWDTHGIPAHFNCQCLKVQRGPDTTPTAPDEVKYPDYPDSWKMFKTNAYKTGVIFPEKHPYFKASKEQKNEIIKAVLPLIPLRKGPATFVDSFSSVNEKVKEPFDKTIGAIENVLNLPELPTIKISSTESKDEAGFYEPYKKNISLKFDGDHVEMTAAHELGHYLNFTAFEKEGEFETQRPHNGKLKDIFKAIKETDTFKEVNHVAVTGMIKISGKNFKLSPKSHKYAKYLVTDIELWARAFSQYIAYKSGDKAMIEQCENMALGDLAKHWTEKDFKNVIFAMDKTFEDLGWLKK